MLYSLRWTALCWACAVVLQAQQAPEFTALEAAYARLREKSYDAAVESFRRAAEIAPARASIRKDLAYTLLNVGENIEAREAFRVAMELDPSDVMVALEYAFLANETGMRREARRVFAKYRNENKTAAEAFANIDRPLAEGISRWQTVLAKQPANFSAHEELARIAEQRDDVAVAIREYEAAWRLRVGRRDLLVDWGRLLKELGDDAHAMPVLLSAAHAPDPRTAEKAKRLLPERYPFVYEFREALALDPGNVALRRELGYLLIAMGQADEGQRELDTIEPKKPVLKDRSDPPSADARALAFRSYESGYFPDAIRYFKLVLDQDPLDFEAMLKLAWSYNMLQRDAEAIPWFRMASRSPNRDIADEAGNAWKRLTPAEQPTQSSVWVFPMFSTRWHTAFGYAQWKTDLKLPFIPLRTYVSTRLVGDSRGGFRQPGYALTQYLSESSVIPAIGISTNPWHGLRLWSEAGVAWSYLPKEGAARTVPDYRGGLALVKAYGTLIGSTLPGIFREHDLDALYIHRFNKTFLVNTRNRIGITLPTDFAKFQLVWNANANVDPRRQYWANFVETGPGFRFRLAFMPPSMLLSADALHGAYLTNVANPRRPNFNDLRLGVFYSVSR